MLGAGRDSSHLERRLLPCFSVVCVPVPHMLQTINCALLLCLYFLNSCHNFDITHSVLTWLQLVADLLEGGPIGSYTTTEIQHLKIQLPCLLNRACTLNRNLRVYALVTLFNKIICDQFAVA